MVEGRQSDEWQRTSALVHTVRNLFADKQFNIAKLLPAHLQPKERERGGHGQQQEAEVTQAAWRGGFKAAFKKGSVR
jgi:hypothetical protein